MFGCLKHPGKFPVDSRILSILGIPGFSGLFRGSTGAFRGSSALFRALTWFIRAILGTSVAHPGNSVGGTGYSVSTPAHSSGLFRYLQASSGFQIRGWTVSHPGKCDCYPPNDPNQPDHHGPSGIFGPGTSGPRSGKV